ncbi:protein-L-isoaspartate O-methyltransferase [Mergibacter septicus]|uniref:Protein-L-isoaspartate O-methyltransferase n=1 Tax=Mergibacter septicus TaxID=221402 RepID=A0A8E3MEM3_9PAST|nr:protein-L-isoaspartate(D-aspartate) O-methyltransferase [Mergibacter septicus]AWX13997.1 protein-L-isoaspartate O-methyltransferase [Mergibacter septicus]AWX14855.1 protein-L-isoaspartate O-methyltransferase [Mergibacter septicus]QDJ13469.1 protein-L-isoaspartate O-methyltransferase [Mergibacter septicus]QDJ14107.1 protein-L-isoaspartate O-methyltransferase [Mergibacter septicus]UTU48443.1 protein-L-isoaspartate(D-aspartate) O-methyltransferase [Mergibacter septicus]
MSTVEQREMIEALYAQGIQDQAVLQVMYDTPRANFIETVFARQSCKNISLPIGHGQTISKPYTVALMTSLLQLNKQDKVLEIGTGCGYQTAILAKLAKQVFSVERIKELQWQAMLRLKKLDLYNITLKHDDGWQGWLAYAPFDAIIVTAAPNSIPHALLEQLADGGRLVLPVGDQHHQMLKRITRHQQQFQVENIETVKFVPLVKGETE